MYWMLNIFIGLYIFENDAVKNIAKQIVLKTKHWTFLDV